MKQSDLAALRKLARVARGAFSVEAFAAGHGPQLAFMRDRSQWIHVMCARQSGKSWGCDGILFDNALASPQSTNLLLGIKGTGVRTNNWEPVWKRLCDKYAVDPALHNETRMMTAFPNGARVMFAGTDDLSNVKKYLGNRLDHGVVIIDEGQDQPDSVFRYILTTLLPPMLTPTSRVIAAGVLPDVEAGYFYELSTAKGWSHHEWGRAANVHTPEAMGQLAAYMQAHGLSEDDPQIQRDWFMKRVWDPKATAYTYSRDRNGYTADLLPIDLVLPSGAAMAACPFPGVDTFSAAIDPGSGDRFSVEVNGWGSSYAGVQHVFDWASERGARLTWGQVAPILGFVQDTYGPVFWRYDAGSSKNELDLFVQDYGIPAIKAAEKADLPGQVRRVNDLLLTGKYRVMIGSRLEEDYQKARWDKDARARGLWKWASQWHPDPSESSRYSLRDYFDSYQAPVERTEEQEMLQRHLRRQAIPQRDRDADKLGLGDYDEAI